MLRLATGRERPSLTAVGALVNRYAVAAGLSGRQLAANLGVSKTPIHFLIAGRDSHGSRYLGIKPERRGEPSLLRIVATELGIPDEEVAFALASDLGFTPTTAAR